LWRPADLGNHRRGNQRNNAMFQAGLVFSPCSPLVSIGGHENGGVIDDGAHAERRTVRDVRSSARTLRRASFISSVVKRPCCFSHSATAAKPARRCSAWRAAAVIQAETLTPSRAAAARMFWWMSGSIVMVSFGDGLPRGIQKYPTTIGYYAEVAPNGKMRPEPWSDRQIGLAAARAIIGLRPVPTESWAFFNGRVSEFGIHRPTDLADSDRRWQDYP